jgi:queuine/archaeosine tRNA-ribosyltransferase
LNELHYYPAGVNFISPDSEILGKPAAWWIEDALVPYNKSLVSYGLVHDTIDFRRKYKIPPGHILIGDSGGFQNATLKKGFSPKSVIRWQEVNCDIGFILDHPPYKKVGTSRLRYNPDIFDSCLERTYYNTEEAFKYRERDDFYLYGVMQGINYETTHEWVTKLSDFDFDGWAVAPKPSNDPMRVAAYGTYALQYGLPIHFFQCISIDVLPILIHLLKYANYNITFDNSYWAYGSEIMHYYYYWKNITRAKFDITDRAPKKLSKLPCKCPVCEHVNNMLHDNSGIQKHNYIYKSREMREVRAIHSLHWYLQEIYTYQILSEDSEVFREYVRLFNRPETLDAINAIDDAIENNCTEELWTKASIKQVNIDDLI